MDEGARTPKSHPALPSLLSQTQAGMRALCVAWIGIVMGFVGIDMVVNFGTPWHTMYPYHGIVGISWVYYNKVCMILLF